MTGKATVFDKIAGFCLVSLVLSFIIIAGLSSSSSAESGFGILVGLIFFGSIGVISVYIYFVPTILAIRRDHAQKQAIIWLNILTGWSFIGWVGSLIWALSNPQLVVSAPTGTPEAYYSSLIREDHPSKRPQTEKICPRCAESVKEAAKVCRYCGHEFA